MKRWVILGVMAVLWLYTVAHGTFLVDTERLSDPTTAVTHIADSALLPDTTALYQYDTTVCSTETVEWGRHYTFEWAFISAGSDSDTVIVELQTRVNIEAADFVGPWVTQITDTGAGAGSDTVGYKFLDADAALCNREWRVLWIYWDPSDSADWNIDNADTTSLYFGARLTSKRF